MRRRQEKSRVENPTVDRALKELLVPSIPLKLVRGSETGRPDDLFLIPGGRPLLIEFKWGEMKPEPKQVYWHGVLESLGYDVEVHNNVEEALQSIALKVVAATLHEEGGEIFARARRGDPNARSRLAENLHYTRSIQLLEKAGCSEQDACDRALKSVLSRVACRN